MSGFFISTLGESSNNDPIIYFIIGQSNAAGLDNGLQSETYLNGPINGAKIWRYDTNQWEILEVGVNNYPDPITPSGPEAHGPELNLAFLARNFYNANIYIVKYAFGATGLEDDWLNGTGYLSNFITIANTAVEAITEPNLRYGGVLWNQGEYDASRVPDSTNYETNLLSLRSQIRSGITGASNVPFNTNRLSSNYSFTYLSTIRAAQEAVGDSEANSNWINNDDYEQSGVSLHFSSNDMNLEAERAFDFFKTRL